MSKNTIIDGIAASEHLDSSGESLSIEGMDISSLGGPDSILNWEHGSKDRPTQVVGKVTFAKKLLKASDAKTKREKYFWNKSKKPMVYIKAELFDGVGHSGAQDVAAMLRYNNKDKGEDSRLVVGFSIEGGKIEKNGMTVTKSIARDVAITVKPCNKVCDAELIEEEVDENFLYKNENFDCEILKNKKNSLNKSFRDVLLEDIKKGDVIKFPGSFNSEKTDQAIKEAQAIDQSSFMKNPDIHEAYKKPHFEALHARFEIADDEPHLSNFKETLKNFHADTHGEPYQNGDTHDIQWGNNHVYKEKGVWNAPFPVPTEIDVKKVGGVLGKGVETGSGPDPFMFMDRKYKTGLNAIKAHKGLPLEINTRSDLIAHDQYIEHLDPKNHVINIHFMSDNDDINRKLEPGAPSVKRRMRAAKKLMDEGFKVNLIHNKLEHEGQNFEFNNHDEQESWKRLGGKLDSIKTVSQKIHPKSYDNIKKILGLDPIKKSLPAMESFKKQVDKFKETKSFKQKEDATKKMDTLMQQKIPQDPASKPKRKFTGDNTPTSFNFKKTSDIKNNMRKAIVAGMMGGSPDSKTGGAALAQEDLSGTLEKPFRSKSQRRFAYANKEKFGGEKGVKEWEEKTPKNIPEKVKKNVNYTHRRMFKNEHNDLLSKVKLNPEHGKMIADAYHNMKHTPDDENTKNAYNALINETKDQFKKLMEGGLKISRIQPGQENPYKNSKELHNDIINNNHLWYFPTEQGYEIDNKEALNHPLLQGTGHMHGDKELLANDMFRIVHDVNGHHIGGQSGFGPTGEHRAFLTHRKMYSPLAQKALASETLGQNSWVNFGPHGEHNRTNPSQTIYAEQKAGLLPDEIIYGDFHLEDKIGKNEKLEKMSKPLMINKELGLGQDPRSDVKTIDPEKTYTTKKGKTVTAPELERKKIQQQYRNKEKEIAGLKPGYDFTPEAKKQIKRYQKQAYGKVVDPKTSLAVNINDPDYEINRSISFKQKDPVKNEMGNEIHETTHAFFSDIANKHGPEKAQKVNKHLLDTHFKPDDLGRIKNFVNSRYGEDYPHKDEEHVTHIWDVLNRPSKRKEFLEQHGHASKLTENSNASDRRLARMKDRALYKRLARGWNNSVKNIKNTEEMKKLLE